MQARTYATSVRTKRQAPACDEARTRNRDKAIRAWEEEECKDIDLVATALDNQEEYTYSGVTRGTYCYCENTISSSVHEVESRECNMSYLAILLRTMG